MYYEERLINGILMFRSSPSGKWVMPSMKQLSQRIIDMKDTENLLREEIGDLHHELEISVNE